MSRARLAGLVATIVAAWIALALAISALERRPDEPLAIADAGAGGAPSHTYGAILPGPGNRGGWNPPVSAVVTSTIASLAAASTSQGGVTLTEGKRLLYAVTPAIAANGIYVAGPVTTPDGGAPVTALSRAPDMALSADAVPGSRVAVTAGTGAGQEWYLETAGPITLGTTALDFEQLTTAPGAWKAPVSAVCTASATKAGPQTCDGVALSCHDGGTCDTVLLTAQSGDDRCGGSAGISWCNGIWTVSDSVGDGGETTWTRRADMASGTNPAGTRVLSLGGTLYALSDWTWTGGTSVDHSRLYFRAARLVSHVAPIAIVQFTAAPAVDGGVGTCAATGLETALSPNGTLSYSDFACATVAVGVANVSWNAAKLPASLAPSAAFASGTTPMSLSVVSGSGTADVYSLNPASGVAEYTAFVLHTY